MAKDERARAIMLGAMFIAGIIIVIFASIAHAQVGDPLLPDPKLTPGATDPLVTQENIQQTICKPGWAKIQRKRDAEEAVKKQVFQEYGISWSRHADFEDDHLISIEIGGSPDSVKNQWPESYKTTPNAHNKDKLEDALHRLVCSGQVTLRNAQTGIAANWMDLHDSLVRQGEIHDKLLEGTK